MKQLLSVVVGVVLVCAVGGSVVNGTMAGFFDTEVSTENEMCAGTLLIRVIGEPIEVEEAWPCKWYTAEKELVNCGTRDGIAYLKLENIMGIEDELGLAVTSEPEYVAEYGGQVGQQIVAGLGEDTCDLYNHVKIVIWFDKDGDGVFETDGACSCSELIYEGKLGQVPPCTKWKLGNLPAAEEINGGWGTYFEYYTGEGTGAAPIIAPLIAGKTEKVGWVSVWNDTAKLYVDYDTRDTTCWEMAETHVYVGTEVPPEHGWGQFPYGADDPSICIKEPCHVRYAIPLDATWVDPLYIAAHAQGCDGETGWAMRGPPRKLKIKLHMQDVEDCLWSGDAKFRDWPTNAYQGDICQFDMKFILNQDCWCRHWRWRGGRGWTCSWFKRW